MQRKTLDQLWPSASPPATAGGVSWRLQGLAELSRVRAQLRRHLADQGHGRAADHDLQDRVVLAFDEMASNALRHGGGAVLARLRATGGCYLIEVCDRATSAPPVPAVDRDPSLGGLGLYLIADLAVEHGWCNAGEHKIVWALIGPH